MSSLHQDRSLVEGSEAAPGARSTLATARGTARGKAGTAEEKAPGTVSTQRQGTAPRSRTSRTAADVPSVAPRSSRGDRGRHAAPPTGAAATIAAGAKAARTATAKAAAAAKAAASATTAGRPATARTATAPAPKARAVEAAAPKVAVPEVAVPEEVAPKAGAAKSPAVKVAATTATPVTRAPKRTAAKVAPATSAGKPTEAKATAKKATATKATVTKATAAKSTATKATAAKSTATKATAAKSTAAKSTATRAAVTTAAPAKRATSVPAAAVTTTSPRRPTPYKRTPADATLVEAPEQAPVVVEERPVPAAPLLVAAPVAETSAGEVATATDETEAAAVVAAVAEGQQPGVLRRRPPSIRRPALYLAAALVGALSMTTIASENPTAQADTMSSSVSVARELGLTSRSADTLTAPQATDRLVELTASRTERDAEQAAAAQAQADADAAAAQAAAEAARPKVVLPVAGARLTSTFGPRWGTMHAGIDLAAPIGTPEYAAMDGVVLEAGPASGFGLAVYIQHENGDVTVYGHMEEILVSAGQVVKAGDPIALLGNRGQSTGPHLHFEVHEGGIKGPKIDPLPWLRDRGVAI